MNNLKKHGKLDITIIGKFSLMVEKQLKARKSDKENISNLTLEELQDFNKILQIADFLLCKYEHKKETLSMMKDFVAVIYDSANSLDALNDQIELLVLSAHTSIQRIKDIQSNISANFMTGNNIQVESKNGGNNLTNSLMLAYPHEYQPKPTISTVKVI